jgi:TM2 domain-containing membrane protein YozV
MRKPYPVWLVTVAAFLLPGSGQMLNGFPVRGIIMQFFMILLGFVTYKISSPDISFIGRFAGGIFVYVFSVIDANTVAKRAMTAWERMSEPEKQGRPPAGAPAKPGARRP